MQSKARANPNLPRWYIIIDIIESVVVNVPSKSEKRKHRPLPPPSPVGREPVREKSLLSKKLPLGGGGGLYTYIIIRYAANHIAITNCRKWSEYSIFVGSPLFSSTSVSCIYLSKPRITKTEVR